MYSTYHVQMCDAGVVRPAKPENMNGASGFYTEYKTWWYPVLRMPTAELANILWRMSIAPVVNES